MTSDARFNNLYTLYKFQKKLKNNNFNDKMK